MNPKFASGCNKPMNSNIYKQIFKNSIKHKYKKYKKNSILTVTLNKFIHPVCSTALKRSIKAGIVYDVKNGSVLIKDSKAGHPGPFKEPVGNKAHKT